MPRSPWRRGAPRHTARARASRSSLLPELLLEHREDVLGRGLAAVRLIARDELAGAVVEEDEREEIPVLRLRAEVGRLEPAVVADGAAGQLLLREELLHVLG